MQPGDASEISTHSATAPDFSSSAKYSFVCCLELRIGKSANITQLYEALQSLKSAHSLLTPCIFTRSRWQRFL